MSAWPVCFFTWLDLASPCLNLSIMQRCLAEDVLRQPAVHECKVMCQLPSAGSCTDLHCNSDCQFIFHTSIIYFQLMESFATGQCISSNLAGALSPSTSRRRCFRKSVVPTYRDKTCCYHLHEQNVRRFLSGGPSYSATDDVQRRQKLERL
jgi:hypothetical protein